MKKGLEYNRKYDVISLKGNLGLLQPISICLVLGYKCDLNCQYCLNPDIEIKNFSNINKYLINLLSEWASIRIVLTGGEPTLYPELLSRIGLILKKMGHFLIVSTNGLHCEQLIHMDWIDGVIISLPGLSSKTYQLMRGKNVFKTVVSSIKSMVNARKEVTMNFTVSSYNIHEVPAAVNFAERLGVKILTYEIIYNIGHAKKCRINVSREQLAHAFKKVPESKNLKVFFPSVGKIFNLIEKGLIVADLNGCIYCLSTEPEYLITSARDLLIDKNIALLQKNIEANRCLHLLSSKESKKEFWNWCK